MKNHILNLSLRRAVFLIITGLVLNVAFPKISYAETNILATQQNNEIKGTVIDASGEPIIGATVKVKGTNNIAISDINGQFTIPNANGKILVISYVGEETVEVKAVDGVKVVMKNNILEQAVVVGYGTQKKATLTGSVGMVSGDEALKARASSNVGTALQGAIPGLTITRSSSRPTDNPKISIRGGISVNNASPLILIDGVDAASWELNQLNPADIENISVLKDAAASIYGARAAGGVILVTTKRAKSGKTTVTYNSSVTSNFQGRDYPAANGSEWAQLMLMVDSSDSSHPNGASSLWPIMGFSTSEYERIRNNEAFDWENNGITYRIDPLNANQVDLVYGNTWGTSQNISIQSGNENMKSLTSFGYSSDRSLVDVTFDGQKKYNFRNNTDYNLGDFIKIQTGVSYNTTKVDTPTYGIGYGLQDFWIFPLYTESGDRYYDNFGGNNVLANLDDGGKTINNQYMLRLNGKITVDLSWISPALKGLSTYAKGSMRQYNSNKKQQGHQVQMYDYYTDEVTNNARTSSKAKMEDMTESNTRSLYQIYEFFLNYQRDFGKHHVTALFGNTNELRDNYSTSMYRSNGTSYVSGSDLNLYDPTTDKIKSSSAYKWSYVSLVSRVNYDYAGKYLVEGTWRHDGSSRLVKKNRWDDFFGFSAGWRISEENFLKNIDWLSNLKLRGSWGQSGNVASIGNYEAYPTIGSATTVYGGAFYPRSWISGITDDTRTWERVISTNVGADFGFFRGRLNGSFDYFWRKNDGMLINITYPSTYGGKAPSTNSGIYKTHGFEFSIKWNDQIGDDFSYHAAFTISNAKTEVTSYAGKTSIKNGVNSIIEGKPLNSLYVFKSDGLFQSQEEVDAYYAQMNGNVSGSYLTGVKQGTANELTPGSVRRVDLNGDNDITNADLEYYGDTDPHYSMSINLGAEYKGFDFSVFFQGVGQQYNVRSGSMGCAFWRGWTNTSSFWIDNTWFEGNEYQEANTSAKFPVASRNGSRNNWNYKQYNSLNVVNSWYLRCKQIQLGYTMPKSVLSKTPFQKVRVWISGSDLFDISNVADGRDPEALQTSGSFSGVDVYPSSVSLGLDITF